jgi:hypothetical protein
MLSVHKLQIDIGNDSERVQYTVSNLKDTKLGQRTKNVILIGLISARDCLERTTTQLISCNSGKMPV